MSLVIDGSKTAISVFFPSRAHITHNAVSRHALKAERKRNKDA